MDNYFEYPMRRATLHIGSDRYVGNILKQNNRFVLVEMDARPPIKTETEIRKGVWCPSHQEYRWKKKFRFELDKDDFYLDPDF